VHILVDGGVLDTTTSVEEDGVEVAGGWLALVEEEVDDISIGVEVQSLRGRL